MRTGHRALYLPILALLMSAGVFGVADARAASPRSLDADLLAKANSQAASLPRLHALIVARDGRIRLERSYRGPSLDTPVNVKSVSKSVISALIGIAIQQGAIEGPGQAIAALLPDRLPPRPDPRLSRITIDHLLSMRAGLERTSGRNYGRWVNSPNWVRHVLSRPFTDDPGGPMRYSTGNTHLLSAILTRATGRHTHALAQAWLGQPLGIAIPSWQRDPQGIFMGGNNMRLSARALFRFGELYRNGGVVNGKRILSESWVSASWTPRTHSPFSGDAYGYGWFIARACQHDIFYARGFGGQFVHVIPSLGMIVVMTSETTTRTRVGGYRTALTALLKDYIIAAALKADGLSCS